MLKLNQLIGFGAAAAVVGGSPPPFTPSAISDLSLWFDADLGLAGTLLNDPISTWAASVGSDATSSGTARPTKATLGGKVCASFDGTNDEMTLGSTPATNSAFTVFGLLYRASTADKFCVIGNASNNLPIGIYPYQSSGVFFGSTSKYGYAADLTTGWNYYVGTWDGTNVALRRNGSLASLSTTTNSGGTVWNRLGKRGSEITKGGLRSVGHYTRVLNSTEIANLEAYLAAL